MNWHSIVATIMYTQSMYNQCLSGIGWVMNWFKVIIPGIFMPNVRWEI